MQDKTGTTGTEEDLIDLTSTPQDKKTAKQLEENIEEEEDLIEMLPVLGNNKAAKELEEKKTTPEVKVAPPNRRDSPQPGILYFFCYP